MLARACTNGFTLITVSVKVLVILVTVLVILVTLLVLALSRLLHEARGLCGGSSLSGSEHLDDAFRNLQRHKGFTDTFHVA